MGASTSAVRRKYLDEVRICQDGAMDVISPISHSLSLLLHNMAEYMSKQQHQYLDLTKWPFHYHDFFSSVPVNPSQHQDD